MRKNKLLLLLLLVVSLVLCTVCAQANEVYANGGNVAVGGGVASGGGGGSASGGGGGNESGNTSSGTCGTDATWVLSSDGTLTISGTGKIDARAFSYNEVNATKVVIEEGITEIGNYAFARCKSLENIISLILSPVSFYT